MKIDGKKGPTFPEQVGSQAEATTAKKQSDKQQFGVGEIKDSIEVPNETSDSSVQLKPVSIPRTPRVSAGAPGPLPYPSVETNVQTRRKRGRPEE
ncbi:hypothetical protein L0222_05980 [bacterium]|nr:hypothetical protein [bacterium]MCI0602976.1 hypothetical protein [bacterium]